MELEYLPNSWHVRKITTDWLMVIGFSQEGIILLCSLKSSRKPIWVPNPHCRSQWTRLHNIDFMFSLHLQLILKGCYFIFRSTNHIKQKWIRSKILTCQKQVSEACQTDHDLTYRQCPSRLGRYPSQSDFPPKSDHAPISRATIQSGTFLGRFIVSIKKTWIFSVALVTYILVFLLVSYPCEQRLFDSEDSDPLRQRAKLPFTPNSGQSSNCSKKSHFF